MRQALRMTWLTLLIAGSLTGCNQNGAMPRQAANQAAVNPQLAEMQQLQQRVASLDANNRDLHSQVAQAQQQSRLLQDEVALLRNRVSDTARNLETERMARQQAEQKLASLESTTRQRGGAIITANNSMTRQLPLIEVPGVQIRQDGELIRIELPSDQIFLQGSATLHQEGVALVDRVADAAKRGYPRQMIGVEGHTDGAAMYGGWTSAHQLSLMQANAVFDQLTRRNLFSPRSLFVLGHGANQPVVSGATPAGMARNRRIEIVIYPETWDGK